MVIDRLRKIEIAVVAVVLIVAFHFVPLGSQEGYANNGIAANICIGYPPDYYFTNKHWIILGGLHAYRSEIKTLQDTNEGCLRPTRTQLYLW